MIDLDAFQGCLVDCTLLRLNNANVNHALRELLPNKDIDLSILTNL